MSATVVLRNPRSAANTSLAAVRNASADRRPLLRRGRRGDLRSARWRRCSIGHCPRSSLWSTAGPCHLRSRTVPDPTRAVRGVATCGPHQDPARCARERSRMPRRHVAVRLRRDRSRRSMPCISSSTSRMPGSRVMRGTVSRWGRSRRTVRRSLPAMSSASPTAVSSSVFGGHDVEDESPVAIVGRGRRSYR